MPDQFDLTPAQRLATGYQQNTLTEHERRRLESIGALHNPEELAKLQHAERQFKAEGQSLAPGLRTALGYAQNAAEAAQITNPNHQ